MIIKMNLQPATNFTRGISILSISIFLILFGLGTYLTSYLKGDINSRLFTISQSLAFGNQPVVIILLFIALFLAGYLNYLRGPAKLYWVRQFFLFAAYAFIITLLWVTTYYSKDDHYILAALIFTGIVIYIITTCVLYYMSMKYKTKFQKSILITVPILTSLVLVGLVISNLKIVKENVIQLFPSLENSMLFLFLVTVLLQGFI